MKRTRLDKIDKKILDILQNNGRITNVELARLVGISAPPCLRRVRALEESGYIQGYHAKLNSTALGYGVTVFAMVRLSSQAEKDLKDFESRLSKMSLVRECYMLAGEVDFILKIVAKSWDEYQDFLTNELTSAPNVTSVKSSLAMRSAKQLPGVPVD
ncbi:MAG: Lrp/AsnC family transcriptional regulator [Alphaproteobacteria bacterium]|nr:Lrp/AsnC family transcriptional regulator [Alphaproteobacteria bacterium]